MCPGVECRRTQGVSVYVRRAASSELELFCCACGFPRERESICKSRMNASMSIYMLRPGRGPRTRSGLQRHCCKALPKQPKNRVRTGPLPAIDTPAARRRRAVAPTRCGQPRPSALPHSAAQQPCGSPRPAPAWGSPRRTRIGAKIASGTRRHTATSAASSARRERYPRDHPGPRGCAPRRGCPGRSRRLGARRTKRAWTSRRYGCRSTRCSGTRPATRRTSRRPHSRRRRSCPRSSSSAPRRASRRGPG